MIRVFNSNSLVAYFMKNIYFIALFMLLSRCGKDVPPPSYLHISEFILENNTDVDYGQLTHGFMDAYVYANDDNLLGVFPIPCTLPLNLEGVYQLRIVPAVRTNGQSGAKNQYALVEPYIEMVNFTRLDTLFVQPTTKYYSTTQVWYEDFEDAALQIQSSGLSMVDMEKSNDPSILTERNGNFFGYVSLNSDIILWDATTSADWSLAPNQQLAYIELDFYNTSSIQTGIRAQNQGGVNNWQHVLIFPQKPEEVTWKKMYLDIKPFLSAAGPGNTFRLMLSAIISSEDTEAFVAIDNIKLVYR